MKRQSRTEDLKWFRFILLTALLFAGTPVLAATNAVVKLANADCLDCHTDPANARLVNGKTVPMANFPTNGFDKSVHAARLH